MREVNFGLQGHTTSKKVSWIGGSPVLLDLRAHALHSPPVLPEWRRRLAARLGPRLVKSQAARHVAESVLSLCVTKGLSHTLLTIWLLLSDDADFFVVVFSILAPLAVYFFQDWVSFAV